MNKTIVLIGLLFLGLASCKSQKETTVEEPEVIEGGLASKLMYSGIDFYARGNEPFWGLDLDFEKNFVFYGLGMDSIVFAPVKPQKAQDANVLRFYALTNSGKVNIQIAEQECTDNMSGEAFDFNVKVQIISRERETLLEGCGNFVPDYRLHDIWALEEIRNTETGALNKLSKPRTSMELYVEKQKVMGKLLCNSFGGSFWQQGKELRFKNMFSTEMACEEDEELTEHEILKNLQNVNNYEIKNLRLKLYHNKELLLVYKKVD